MYLKTLTIKRQETQVQLQNFKIIILAPISTYNRICVLVLNVDALVDAYNVMILIFFELKREVRYEL